MTERKKKFLFGVFFAFCFLAFAGLFFIKKVQALPSDSLHTSATYQDDGDSVYNFAVNVGSTTPALLFSNTVVANERWIDVCNNQATYTLFVGTFSAITNSASTLTPAIGIPPNWCEPLNENTTYYAIYQIGGATTPVRGQIRYSSQ